MALEDLGIVGNESKIRLRTIPIFHIFPEKEAELSARGGLCSRRLRRNEILFGIEGGFHDSKMKLKLKDARHRICRGFRMTIVFPPINVEILNRDSGLICFQEFAGDSTGHEFLIQSRRTPLDLEKKAKLPIQKLKPHQIQRSKTKPNLLCPSAWFLGPMGSKFLGVLGQKFKIFEWQVVVDKVFLNSIFPPMFLIFLFCAQSDCVP